MQHLIRSLGLTSYLALASSCAADRPLSRGDGATLDIEIAALDLITVGDAIWDIEVVNGATPAEVVWSQRITASRYGDGVGSATYVGPCDAAPGADQNVVRLWLVGLYDAPVAAPGAFASGSTSGAGAPAGTPLAFQSPTATAPLTRTVTCRPNADTRVDFDVHVMRPAGQGFFNLAVTFDDIFCSAKFDCCHDRDGTPGCAADGSEDNLLLHDGDGERSATMVLAFACTAGPGSDTQTALYLDALELDCTEPSADSFVADLRLDPSGASGNQCPAGALGACPAVLEQRDPSVVAVDDHLFQIGVYRGFESLTTGNGELAGKAYWNVALGVHRPAISACRLRTRGTADDALDPDPLADGVVRLGVTYPFVRWDVDLATCGEEALSLGDDASMVHAAYTSAEVVTSFDYGYAPDGVFEPTPCGKASLRINNQTDGPIEVEVTPPEARSSSRFMLARGDLLGVPLPAGTAAFVARVAGHEEPGVLLTDERVNLGCDETRVVPVRVSPERWLAPIAASHLIDGAPAPDDAPPFACGVDKERARLEEIIDPDGNRTMRLSCPVPNSQEVAIQTLELAFPPSPTGSVALDKLVTTFGQYKNVGALAHFQIGHEGATFYPFTAAGPAMSNRGGHPAFPGGPGQPGRPKVWVDTEAGGQLSFYAAPQLLDGQVVTGELRWESHHAMIGSPAVHEVEYRSFEKLPGTGPARFLLQWASHKPKEQITGSMSCFDLPPPPAMFLEEEIELDLDRGDPLYDQVRFDITFPPQDEALSHYLRLVPVASPPSAPTPLTCPTNWITMMYGGGPTILDCSAFPSQSPCTFNGCDWVDDACTFPVPPPFPPGEPSAVSVEILRYVPPIIDPVNDFTSYYVTLDAYDTTSPGCDPYCAQPGNPFGWPEGCVYRPADFEGIDLTPWWKDVINGIVSVYEAVADLWNAAVAAVVYTIAFLIPGCEADCDQLPGNGECPGGNVCGEIVEKAVHIGLTALGVPPQVPSFERLLDEGGDYLAELAASQLETSGGVPAFLSKPLLEKATDKMVAAAKNSLLNKGNNGAENPWNWGTMSPYHHPHPARIYVRVTRSLDPMLTHVPHSMSFFGGNNRLFRSREIELPTELQPGQSIVIPIVLEPLIYPPIGVPFTPGYGQYEWQTETYQNGAAMLDLRVGGATLWNVPAGQHWPDTPPIPFCP